MTGTRPPVARIPPVAPGQGGGDEVLGQEPVLVELSSSSKFGIAWPAEQPPQVPLPLGVERPVVLSSLEGETDISEEEISAPPRRNPRPEDFGDDSDFVTPTNHLESEQNPMDQAGRLAVPRLSRAFSMPLPSQLSALQNPRRTSVSEDSVSPSPVVNDQAPEQEHFRELSLELADSVQMVIQTLLQLSPPQVLDPAKEQFAACSLAIPTPSISAMFTTMKNLNYMSANMSQLSSDPRPNEALSSRTSALSPIHSDFDVGEMLQSAGDALSGVAAQACVDLVLFHSDIGMKHVAARGDENGISYALSHVIRQVIGTAQKGDTVEVGLYMDYVEVATAQSSAEGLPTSRVASPTVDFDGLLRCNFRILHRLSTTDIRKSSEGETEDAQPANPARPSPSFDTLFLRRLLKHVGATLTADSVPAAPSANRMCEFSVNLEPGEPSAVNPSVTVTPEDAAILGYLDMHISNEPTLEQLSNFAETLRGKSVTLHASSSGSFAHHLSSYLTAWGMDVSHMPTEPGADGEYELIADTPDTIVSVVPGIDLPPTDVPPGTPPAGLRKPGSDPVFILIDDDVAVLRSRLQKIKLEPVYPLNMNSRSKRPSLATNHRPRSSPQVARVMGMLGNSPPQPQVVIVHFTSLSNFKLVKDAIQTILTPTKEPGATRIPEVIVIPKPAGPRRFLTALHTAVTRPVVDPYFVPTATSPMSPGLHSISPFFNLSGISKSPGGRSTTSIRTGSDRPTRSPKELGGEWTTGHAPPSLLSQSDNIEYFSDAVVKLGSSPATGLLIQSPDGQPTSIFFHPKPKNTAPLPPSPNMEREAEQFGRQVYPPSRHRAYSRVPSGNNRHDNGGETVSGSSVPTLRPSPRLAPTSSETVDAFIAATGKGKTRQVSGTVSEDSATSSGDQAAAPPAAETAAPQGGRQYPIRRPSHQPTSPPTSPKTRAAPAPGSRRLTRRPTPESHASSPTGGAKKAAKGPPDSNIVPPISVLIVEDNPINQTILTTFMRKKKIKHDVAKNGEEAIQKWRYGTFHLILMDIQMPVMDGIQATKEIRRLEKQSGQPFPSTPQSEGQRTPSEASTTDSRSVSTPPYRSSVIIVALTASSLQADRVAALAAGCNDFLTKPVTSQWLNNKIIEWGSIKALQMWADIRPDVVRSITTEQTAQAQQVARRLHVPEGRSSTPSTGERPRGASMATRRALAEAAGGEKVVTPNTPLSDDSPGLSSAPDPNKPSTSTNPMMPPIASMTASEAALSLASAHRPQASADATRSSLDGKASDASLPTPSSEAIGASEPPPADAEASPPDLSVVREPPTEPVTEAEPQVDTKDDAPVPEEEAPSPPPPPPEAEPQ